MSELTIFQHAQKQFLTQNRMATYENRSEKNKSTSNEISKESGNPDTAFHFVDNRKETVVQKKMQEIMKHNKPNKPYQMKMNRVGQLKSILENKSSTAQFIKIEKYGTKVDKDYEDSSGLNIFNYFKKKIESVRIESMGPRSKKRNVGVAGIVGGTEKRKYTEFSAISGEKSYDGRLDSVPDDERMFSHKKVQGHTSKHDSENKLLEKIAKELGGAKGEVFEDVTETVYLASEIQYCASCRELVPQFKTMFPNSKLIFVDGTRGK